MSKKDRRIAELEAEVVALRAEVARLTSPVRIDMPSFLQVNRCGLCGALLSDYGPAHQCWQWTCTSDNMASSPRRLPDFDDPITLLDARHDIQPPAGKVIGTALVPGGWK